MVWDSLQISNVGPHFGYVLLLGLALGRQILFVILHHANSVATSSIITMMVVHVFWPPCLWLVLLNSFAIPIRCAFSPLSIPNRSQLLKKDPVQRASYPSEVTESLKGEGFDGRMVTYTAIVVYTALIGIFGYLNA